MRKVWLLLLFILVALVMLSGVTEQLSVDRLKAGLEGLQALRANAPWSVALIYFLVYVLATAVSLPGAVVLTLAGGALFGLAYGTLIVSFASSIGALLAFLLSRYLFHDWVQSRFGDRLAVINEGIRKEGAFYLFTLRLVPLLPFFLINLLMGLTPMGAWRFYWVSQIGMLAGTLVYVNAGTQLAGLTGPADIVSPALILSFVLLGLFPWFAKAAVNSWRRRQHHRHIYGRWMTPKRFDRNLIVIGAGAAGLVSAYMGAALKARVTLIEANKMGGDCLHFGCVPSKTLIRSARLAHDIRHANRFGLNAGPVKVSFERVMARVRQVIAAIEPHDSVERYTSLGVEVLQGHASLVDPWTVEVVFADGSRRQLSGRHIILATGASPIVPPLPGLADSGYVTSETLWQALSSFTQPPERVVMLGGGPIGCELSQALARLGSRVTLVEKSLRLLDREDQEVSDLVQYSLSEDGVQVLTGHQAICCEIHDEQRCLTLTDSQGDKLSLAYDLLVVAIGRQPRLEGFGLEALGIKTGLTVHTNEYLETVYPHIFAAGDVVGPYQLTHVAAHQAWYAVINALFGSFYRFKADYRVIPVVTFVDPEVARVGLNEQAARQQGIAYEVTRYDLDDLDRAIIDGSTQGFVKVLTVPGKDRILGATIVGVRAAELLTEFVLAMRWNLGLNKILATIHSYPGMAEANKFTAGQWRRNHGSGLLLKILTRFNKLRRGEGWGSDPQA
jgi:pyruvate/2-oxoglutarate dehydrogenase complex dihydrolipoamide dehydrogenase (E3) component/uncharacterized membrane protein YdjX (TVP38/TMEM64 family)